MTSCYLQVAEELVAGAEKVGLGVGLSLSGGVRLVTWATPAVTTLVF
jgi:hypothetical protein